MVQRRTRNGSKYPLYRASGNPRELGRQHGEQAQLRIRGFVGWMSETMRLSESSLARRALSFLPLFERDCPHLLDEIRGLAEGAQIRFEQALACQIRGELAMQPEGGCTSFVVGRELTASGQVLIGQTSDMPAEIREFSYVLNLVPDDRPELLMWTFGGMLGYHGLNRHGVAHFANSLGGGPGWQRALPHYPLKRMLLEQTSMAGVQSLLARVSVCSNGNYVLCDGQGAIADVELTSAGPQILSPGPDRFFAHANHYLCPALATADNFAVSLPDSFGRQDRLRELILASAGRLTVDSFKQFLADHSGHPTSICRHPHEGADHPILPCSGRTVAAIVAEPEAGRMHLCPGNPCEQPFVEYWMS